MAQEIDLGGTIYISSKHAAEKTGYTQDYIGQLARGGAIEAKRVSGMWYILEESLRSYKEKADQFVPTPPQGFQPAIESETSVSFDGKDYISANRAAKITRYNQDYVGQLARSGAILSRQVGNRWYVDRESLLTHKKEKDDLLAAVQVQSVGLAKPESVMPEPEKPSEATPPEEVTHFEYVQEESPLIPDIPPSIPEVEIEDPEPMPEFPRRKVAAPTFEEYREALRPSPTPITIRKIEEEPQVRTPEPEPIIETPAPRPAPAPVAFARQLPPEPLPEAEIYGDSLDEALNPGMNHSVRVTSSHVEETVYIEEDAHKPRKSRKASTFMISGIAVVAAVGTLVYIGSSLGILNLASMISWSDKGQNAAVANSVIQNGSGKMQKKIRDLFSKEIVYTRE